VLADADVQKAALNVVINSVCGPVTRVCTESFRNFISGCCSLEVAFYINPLLCALLCFYHSVF
jgi:hypothetical protein